MTEKSFKEWLESYLRPQERNNAEMIKHIFARNSIYWWGPFNDPRNGIDAIYEHHRNALSHQEDIMYDYEVLAVTEEYGIAKFHLTLKDLIPGEPGKYDGIFKVCLDGNNKCTLFEEWYNFID